MSGTALADWAVAENPLRYTLQAAQQVDCPLAERDDELAACLRFKRVTELMSVRLQALRNNWIVILIMLIISQTFSRHHSMPVRWRLLLMELLFRMSHDNR